jgi:hypothetical protein
LRDPIGNRARGERGLFAPIANEDATRHLKSPLSEGN